MVWTRESDSEGEEADEAECERTGTRLRQLGLAEYQLVTMDPGVSRAKAGAAEVKPEAELPQKLTEEDYQVTLALKLW
jgi:hypothetical protein